jgi:hypothetical protein
VLTYLANTLHVLATQAGVAETDTADGWAYAIDQAFAALGYEDTDAATSLPNTATPQARAVARYYALETIWTALAARVDTSRREPGETVATVTERHDQRFQHVAALLAEAKAHAAALGVPVEAAPEMTLERIGLDFLTADAPAPARRDWWVG